MGCVFCVSPNSNWHVKAPTKTIIISPEQSKAREGKKGQTKVWRSAGKQLLLLFLSMNKKKPSFQYTKRSIQWLSTGDKFTVYWSLNSGLTMNITGPPWAETDLLMYLQLNIFYFSTLLFVISLTGWQPDWLSTLFFARLPVRNTSSSALITGCLLCWAWTYFSSYMCGCSHKHSINTPPAWSRHFAH